MEEELKKVNETLNKQNDEMKKQLDAILDNQRKITKEIHYNRIVFGLVMLISLLYIWLQTKHLGDILGTLIEIFLPN